MVSIRLAYLAKQLAKADSGTEGPHSGRSPLHLVLAFWRAALSHSSRPRACLNKEIQIRIALLLTLQFPDTKCPVYPFKCHYFLNHFWRTVLGFYYKCIEILHIILYLRCSTLKNIYSSILPYPFSPHLLTLVRWWSHWTNLKWNMAVYPYFCFPHSFYNVEVRYSGVSITLTRCSISNYSSLFPVSLSSPSIPFPYPSIHPTLTVQQLHDSHSIQF